MTHKKNDADRRMEVRQEARMDIQDINRDARAAKEVVREGYEAIRESGVFSRQDMKIVKDSMKATIEEIENDRRDGVDSIRDLRDEYLSGESRSARTTERQMRDAVEETEYQIEQDII